MTFLFNFSLKIQNNTTQTKNVTLPNYFENLRLNDNSISSLFQNNKTGTAQKMKFSIKDFFSKCDQIRSFLRIWSYLLQKSLMEDFIFCAMRARGFKFHSGQLSIATSKNHSMVNTTYMYNNNNLYTYIYLLYIIIWPIIAW